MLNMSSDTKSVMGNTKLEHRNGNCPWIFLKRKKKHTKNVVFKYDT